MRVYAIFTFIGLLTLSMFSTIANASTLEVIELKNLRNNLTDKPFAINDKVHVLMFMQPDCKWCKKQKPTLKRIAKTCDASVNVTIVGFNGAKRDLKREARHYEEETPIYLADNKLIKALGGIQTSPSFVFLDNKNNVVGKYTGYLTPKKIFRAISILSGGHCRV